MAHAMVHGRFMVHGQCSVHGPGRGWHDVEVERATFLVGGPWSMAHPMVHGRLMVHGQCSVHGPWPMVHGPWVGLVVARMVGRIVGCSHGRKVGEMVGLVVGRWWVPRSYGRSVAWSHCNFLHHEVAVEIIDVFRVQLVWIIIDDAC